MNYQFNKTALQEINKQLKARKNALPTLKSKESALRLEVQKHKLIHKKMLTELQTKLHRYESILPLYSEFPEIVSIDKIIMEAKKIAGVRVPIFDHVKYITEEISFFKKPSWFIEGIIIFKEITSLKVKIITEEKTILILEKARRKTTQKVNLYEKVQIPYFEEAIKKIKRFLEDEENLDKSGQKIVKKRLELAQVVVN